MPLQIYTSLVCLISWREIHERRLYVGGGGFAFQPKYDAIEAVCKPACYRGNRFFHIILDFSRDSLTNENDALGATATAMQQILIFY